MAPGSKVAARTRERAVRDCFAAAGTRVGERAVLTHPGAEKARARGAADDILPGRGPAHSPPIR